MFDADYSQIEYRTLVALAKELKLAELFKDPDTDYHTLMASLMYGVPYASVTPQMRGDAKSFNFGIPYGMGFKSLAILLTGMCGPSQVEEAKEKYELYFKDQPNVRKFFNNVKEMAQVNKYTKTYWNRYRYYSFTDKDGNISNSKKAAALRQAGNAIIQGCLHPETKIQTLEYGIVEIQDVVNQHLHVWDGDKWSNGDILYSGKKRKCIVKFSNGQEFICSPIHKFSVIRYDKDISEVSNGKRFVECKDLKAGIRVDCNKKSSLTVKNQVESVFVESVEITDDYIDMYDVCNTDGGYYVADGIITHNTAADIFKISVARNFLWIRNNNLLGDVLIVNMVHDEQLMEINCDKINTLAAVRDIVRNMEFKVNGFPPLYIGAGFGMSWKSAKGKMAEIHPNLAEQFSNEAQGMSLLSDCSVDNKEVLKYYDDRVYQFRLDKVKQYLEDSNNFGKDLHPVIGNLINLQFTYGLEDEYSGDELTFMALKKFIEVNGLDVDANMFRSMQERVEDTDEDAEYEDDPEEELDGDEYGIMDNEFALIDEDDKLFGISLQDLIKEFGLIVSQERRVCGIDIRIMPYKKKDELVEFLIEHQTTSDDEDAMQVVFLQENNVLFNTNVWVSGIDGSSLNRRLGLNALAYR